MEKPLDLGLTYGWFRQGRRLVKIPYGITQMPPSFDYASLLSTSMQKETELWEAGIDEAPAGSGIPDDSERFTAEGNPTPDVAPPLDIQPCWELRRPAGATMSLEHARRKWKREEEKRAYGHLPRPETIHSHVFSAQTTAVDMDFANSPVTNGAYSMKNEKLNDPSKEYFPDELVNELGFLYVEWDGVTGRSFTDQANRNIVILAGRPNDPKYLAAADAAYKTMQEEACLAKLEASEPHRRGAFPVINVGVTHANGTEHPVNRNNHSHSGMAQRLLADPSIIRLANFASCKSFLHLSSASFLNRVSAALACFQMWMPKVYGYYRKRLDSLFDKMPVLRRIFPASIFPSAAFNFGPRVWTYKHKDVFNCPFGMCGIQALGRFNPKTGGHIILWEPKLVVEFPPASLILIPSAAITHSNVPVAEGEERASFTQYCTGGLFRYVDAGFRKETRLKAEDPDLYRKLQAQRPHMWNVGLSLLSRPEDFREQLFSSGARLQ